MPTSEDALLKELLATFQIEAVEHLQALNQALLQLERRPDEAPRQELLRTAFRAAHSLKGAARAVSLTEIEQLSHAMESVLQAARDANLVLTADACDVLYDTLDAIQQILDGKVVGIDSLQTRLAAVGGDVPAQQPDAAAPAPPDSASVPEPDAVPVMSAPTDETIRVAVDKLDNLMAQAGELLVARISSEQRLTDMQELRAELTAWPRTWREIKTLLPHVEGDVGEQLNDLLNGHHARLQVFMREIDNVDRLLNHDASRLGMVATQLQDEVRRVRMVPFQQMVLTLERAVRDAAHSEDKQIALRVTGSDVELDKKVLEQLKDPLLHLLRNAVSHGIETPDVRQQAGKAAEGLITLSVQHRGSEVRITVRDDGRGFDLDALRQAGKRMGARVDDGAGAEELIALAFLPGMTTAGKVTAMAGRGVGLDVVRQSLETLQGRIEVDSQPGEGSTFRLSVPSSLTMTRGLLVRIGGARFVIPLLSIQKIVPPVDVVNVESQPMLMVDDSPLPLVSLAAALDLPLPDDLDRDQMLAVVVGVAEQRMALLVDDVVTELELAVKPLGRPLKRVRNVAGAAMLGDGSPVIVLNPADLVKSARGTHGTIVFSDMLETEDEGPPAHILVVDDSITTRTLEKNILEAAGFRITIATDGTEALERLKGSDVDLVVSDIQMPIMDGIELTTNLRAADEYQDMPIILVTSLESREDRERGMLAGANAYIVKRGFDQAELLATIRQYLS
jgi:two-component system chemotaxis sensor kinase CheA